MEQLAQWLSLDFVARLDYKPNWVFGVVYDPVMDHCSIKITMDVPDSRGSGKTVPVGITDCLYPSMADLRGSEQFWKEYFHRQITRIEQHEIDEWFRLDGELVRDPHK